MARLPYLTPADLPEADRDILARDLNLYAALAHSPGGARAFGVPALYVRHDSPLDARLRELAIIQIGFLTETSYEYAHHVEIGLDAGLTPDDIRGIAADTRAEQTHFGALERAVLMAARQLVRGTTISDDVYAILAAELETRDIVDLIIVISTYCGVVRLLGALEIELEAGYETILRDYPLTG